MRRAYVLDDELPIGELVCKVLETCGIVPRQFTSPMPFFAELDVAAPELIVLDLSLGQSDAVEVIRHLKVIDYRGNVLLISGRYGKTLDEITQVGQRHGLAMLRPLRKPFRAAELKQRLSRGATDEARFAAPGFQPDASAPERAPVQLEEALSNSWLELWYQPKIDLRSLAVCGAEALVRARHPALGIVMPDRLLPPSGDPDYQPLTAFVVERAMADWARFARQGLHLKLSVNAPVSVMRLPSFITLVRSVLPADPKFPGLIVEVTEDEAIRDSKLTHEISSQLKLYNVDISIDDFGSGNASLSRLNDLSFAEVKIDRSFVAGCASNRLQHGLCRTVVDLAHRFGATACAEGVDTVEDLHALINMRCNSAQGFLFAEAMPAAELASTLLVDSAKSLEALLRMSSRKNHWLAQSA